MANAMMSSGPKKKLGIDTPIRAKNLATLSIQELR
jgi:hypothetical protein